MKIENQHFIIQNFSKTIDVLGLTNFGVAKEIDISPSHLWRVFKNERDLSNQLREKLNTYLKTDF